MMGGNTPQASTGGDDLAVEHFLRPRLKAIVNEAREAGFSLDVIAAVLIDLSDTIGAGANARKDSIA